MGSTRLKLNKEAGSDFTGLLVSVTSLPPGVGLDLFLLGFETYNNPKFQNNWIKKDNSTFIKCLFIESKCFLSVVLENGTTDIQSILNENYKCTLKLM